MKGRDQAVDESMNVSTNERLFVIDDDDDDDP
eukprot:CAMPEP_0119568490 /NCGR_PEP_ID=MMETSP1352-20130426/39029_1 /TAXON_ID=265584 /ORGANISM="Stauroneis constricta, Strain CCMP1120" /LENGTH=31 /DNA_ID= /DNA_START= /DNA_END= /DNA_ORIENTATION=